MQNIRTPEIYTVVPCVSWIMKLPLSEKYTFLRFSLVQAENVDFKIREKINFIGWKNKDLK